MTKNIGVLIGRFQPFHKGHQQLLRGVLLENDKVYVLVAGNGKSNLKNPIPYWLRKLSIKCINKVKVIKAKTGFLPELLEKHIPYNNNIVRIYCSGDRVGNYSQQFSKDEKLWFNAKFVEYQDRFGDVSGTGVRKLIKEKNKEEFYTSMSILYSETEKFLLYWLYRFYLREMVGNETQVKKQEKK